MTMDVTESEDEYWEKFYAALREVVLDGGSAVDAIRFQLEKLQLGPASRCIVMWHFRQAFGIHMKDIISLTNWDFFIGQGVSEEAINAEITPILKDHALRVKNGELKLD